MTGRIVVAGIGNIFLGDDGFGVEVVSRLTGRPSSLPLSAGVEVVDVGIRGVHLAYDLLDGCELLVLVDAAPLGRPPGTVTVLELDGGPHPGRQESGAPATVEADAHAMTPQAVLALVRALGGRIGRTVLVACEPADLAEGIGLSATVEAAVDASVATVRRLVAEAAAQVTS